MVEEPPVSGQEPKDLTSTRPTAFTGKEPSPEWMEFFRENGIPITGVRLMLLSFCLLSHFGTATGWTKAKDITDTLVNIVQILAILAGGWWAYFKFIKGRAYQESLIPAVAGKLISIESKTYLVANIRVKNVGQSVINFAPDASSLRVFGYTESMSKEIVSVDDTKLAQFVALDDLYIEPNEAIEKTRFISIPTEVKLGLRLELEIISSHKNYTWGTSFLVEKTLSNAIINSGDADVKETR